MPRNLSRVVVPPFARWPWRAKLVTPEALRLASLWSVTVDLDRVTAFCERLEALSADRDQMDAPNDDVAFDAFWTGALVAYARCFATGRRTQLLDPEDMPPVAIRWHDTFMALRNEHVAHHVDQRLEGFFVDALLSDPSAPHRVVEQIAVSGHKRTAASPEHVHQLAELARMLRTRTDRRIELLRDAVFSQAGSRPVDELYSTPGSEITMPARTGPRPPTLKGRRTKRSMPGRSRGSAGS